MQPVHKTSKRPQPEITIQCLNLINYYGDTIFVLPTLGTGQGLPNDLGNRQIFGTLDKLT